MSSIPAHSHGIGDLPTGTGTGQIPTGPQVQALLDASGVSLSRVKYAEDFRGPAGTVLPAWLATQDTSPAGAPVLDYENDAAGGWFILWLAVNNEIENITLFGGDDLPFDITQNPIFETRITIESDVTGAGGLFGAGDRLVVGIGSARNADPDLMATSAWFLFGLGDHNVYIESDDGVTDNDDIDTGINWTEGNVVTLKIDASDLTRVRFFVNDVDATPQAMNMAAAAGNLQVFIQLQKAAALNMDHRVRIDVVDTTLDRP